MIVTLYTSVAKTLKTHFSGIFIELVCGQYKLCSNTKSGQSDFRAAVFLLPWRDELQLYVVCYATTFKLRTIILRAAV